MNRLSILLLRVLCAINVVSIAMETQNQKNIKKETEDLLWAITVENIPRVEQLIMEGNMNINMQNNSLFSPPLIIATSKNNILLVKTLIKAGVDVNRKDKNNKTALVYAIENKDLQLATLLVNAKADINIIIDDETLLELAVKSCDIELVKLLIDNGSTQKDKALLSAAETYYTYTNCTHHMDLHNSLEKLNKSHINILQFLIKSGAHVNTRTKHNYTPLIFACTKDNNDAVIALIEAGADVHVIDQYGETPLIDVARKGNIIALNALIKAHAEIPNTWKKRVLELAVNCIRNFPDMAFNVINPMSSPRTRNKIETIIMFYRNTYSHLSELPPEILKIILTYAYPEFAIDLQTLACLHPHVVVDTLPLETIASLIKNKTLNQKDILEAWKQKLVHIVAWLNVSGNITNHDYIQLFEDGPGKRVIQMLT